jgi:ribonucleotide monophosphatase NagD (HAD superfamily)
MYGSAYITAHYLSLQHPQINKVRIVGMNSICNELAKVGIECVGGENEYIECENVDDFFAKELDCTVGAVVVGLDTKFTYKKLAMAAL